MNRILALAPVLIAILLAGCGGGAGGGQVAVDTSLPPLDFTLRPGAEPLEFSVEISNESEFRGTGYNQSVRYRWRAADWQLGEDGNWTCTIRYSKIRAAGRRGSSISMEPITEFEQLEGFEWRYRIENGDFEPATEIGRTTEFLGMLSMLEIGIGTFSLEDAGRPVRPGSSWTLSAIDDEDRREGTVFGDSLVTFTYEGDEPLKGIDCAKIAFKGKIGSEGEVEMEEETLRMSSKIDIEGTAWVDKRRGFTLKSQARAKTRASRKGSGPERNFTQILNLTVLYLGS